MKSPIIVVGFVMLILLSISANANYIYSTDDFKTEVLPNWLNIYGSYTIDTSGNGYLENITNSTKVVFNAKYQVFAMKGFVYSAPMNHSYYDYIYMNSSVYYTIGTINQTIEINPPSNITPENKQTLIVQVLIVGITVNNKETTIVAYQHSGGVVSINQTKIGDTIHIHARAGKQEGSYSFNGSGINWNSTFTMTGYSDILVDSLTVATGEYSSGNATPSPSPLPKIPNTPEVGGVSVVWWGVIAGTIGAVIYWAYIRKKVII